MLPMPVRTSRIPKREHRALPHRRSQCPAWLVAAGMELLGRWIRSSRVQLGLTQAQLARLAGVSQTTVSRLERGKLEGLALYRLVAIIAALDVASRHDLRSPIGW
jgi:DNA-binding XRE family transcriptional regulator